MVILGIDPGLALMGYGVLDYTGGRYKVLTYGCISTVAHSPMPQRLRSIYTGLSQLIDIYQPSDIAFEELFFAQNVTTGIAVAQARGAALVAAAQHTENLYEYTPLQIKQAITGYGRAEKQQMQQMVKLLLGMDEIVKPDDAADALAVAITHSNCLHAKEMYRIK
ncbi:MAG: crossover junction endodeoxyribonuclease RuvC [Clostridia bacterium]|nr:crossover junction endodeoxyribonuclease RuvC [Clostridia bacterium]MBQ9409669.1 crossover junction endodeoxyribonuclease RuvC [Clostridia bacterium]